MALLAPKLFVREWALSSLLPPPTPVPPLLADRPVTCKGGNFTLPIPLVSCGVPWLPMGVARLSFGGAFRGMYSGGIACDSGGFTGLTFGEGGMARPSLGVLAPLWFLVPGMGGLSNGAAEDMSILAGEGCEGDVGSLRGVDGAAWSSAAAGIWCWRTIASVV